MGIRRREVVMKKAFLERIEMEYWLECYISTEGAGIM